MRILIELKKVEQQDLHLFLSALLHHSNMLQILNEATKNRSHSLNMSIAAELWYELSKKTTGQFPVEFSLLKLSLHKSYILMDALRDYFSETSSDLEKSRCNRYILAIDQQLPTPTQLSIQLTHNI